MKSEKPGIDYWDEYYEKSGPNVVPSQFAAFVLNEFPDHSNLIEFGCGSGRDSLFFSRYKQRVLGIDASGVAISNCNALAKKHNLDNLMFLNFDMSSTCVVDDINNSVDPSFNDPIIYARFFLHAIDEECQSNFFRICNDIKGINGKVAVEFRTEIDSYQPKETAAHYRRFISTTGFINDLHQAGFKISYFCQGTGYAKYKKDDAHVARFIFS